METLICNLVKLQTLEFSKTPDASTAAVIAELRGQIPPPILGHYERLTARGKKGLAAVQNQVCTGCHMRLPLAVIMSLKHGADIQLCDSCGRYLYLQDEPENAPVNPPPPAKAARPARRQKKTASASDSRPMDGSVPAPARAQPRINPE